MSEEAKDEGVWLVARSANSKIYYVVDINETTKEIVWAPSRKNALKFHTQAGVSKFYDQFMKTRDGVYLVHTKVK